MATPRSRHRRSDAGAVLLIVMLVMMGLLGLGVTALWLTSGNLQISGNMNQRQQALAVAEAGLARALAVLNADAPPMPTNLLNGMLNPSPPIAGVAGFPGDNVPASPLDAAGLPVGFGALMREGGIPLQNIDYPPASFNRNPGTADAPTPILMGRYTVWIRNDTAEIRRGFWNIDGGNAAVVVRSVGVAVDGRTQVVLESTLVPGNTGNPPDVIVTITPPVLCYSGKNACDDNSGTAAGLEVSSP